MQLAWWLRRCRAFSRGERSQGDIQRGELQVVVRSLYSVRHKARQAYSEDARDFYKFFFSASRPTTLIQRRGWKPVT